MDNTDVNILRALQADGRMTNVELAAHINLSPSACLRRVQHLEAKGIINGYAMQIGEAALGRRLSVFVEITLDRQTEDFLAAFEDAVSGCEEVMECYLMSGHSDYLLRVAACDAEDYERVHKEILSRLPGVARIQTSIALRRIVRRQVTPPKIFNVQD